jgi:hypothetical protein
VTFALIRSVTFALIRSVTFVLNKNENSKKIKKLPSVRCTRKMKAGNLNCGCLLFRSGIALNIIILSLYNKYDFCEEWRFNYQENEKVISKEKLIKELSVYFCES